MSMEPDSNPVGLDAQWSGPVFCFDPFHVGGERRAQNLFGIPTCNRDVMLNINSHGYQ